MKKEEENESKQNKSKLSYETIIIYLRVNKLKKKLRTIFMKKQK